jgi:hypothetical protein
MVVLLAGCAGTTTVTERAPEPKAATTPTAHISQKLHRTPAKLALNNPAQKPDPTVKAYCNEVPEGHACHAVTATPSDPNESPQRNCDTNVVVNSQTSCALAENAFYELYESRNVQEKYRSVMVYSPATHKNYELGCDHSGLLVACTSSPLSQSIYISFPQAAIDVYTETQAAAYARTRDIGHPGITAAMQTERTEAAESGPRHEPESVPEAEREPEEAPDNHSEDESFCSTHACIGEYEKEPGTVVECADGTYSHAGGIQGACSHHGGER